MHGAQIHQNFSSSQPSYNWVQRETRKFYSTTLLIKSIQRQRSKNAWVWSIGGMILRG